MKFLVLTFLLVFINLGVASAKTYTMVTSAQIDLKNLFESFKPVHFSDYGLPQQVAHSYLIKTSYQIPENLRASSSIRVTNPYRSCRWNVCRDYPGYNTETVVLKHKDLKVTWELIEEKSKEVISTVVGAISLEFASSANLGQPLHLNGQNINAAFVISGPDSVQGINLEIPNPVSSEKIIVNYSIDFARQRLSELKFSLEDISNGLYQLSSVNFTDGFTKTIFKTQGSMLNFDRERIGFYFSIGPTHADLPTISESMISNN